MSYIKIEIFDSNTNQKKIMLLEPWNKDNSINENTYLNAINFLETEINLNQHKPFFKLWN
jgi:hypothetical protein